MEGILLSKGTKVRVYFNLHSKTFTVQEYIKGVGWRKAMSVDDIVLHDVEFKVSESGRQRCIREGKKNVHAYAIGTVHRYGKLHNSHMVGATPISYNPYKCGSFVAKEYNDEPVWGAVALSMSTTHGVNAWGLIGDAVAV